jgi:hypothetical protein
VAVGSSDDHAEQRTGWQLRPLIQPWPQGGPPPGVHADLASAIVLSVADENRPALLVEIGVDQRQRLVDPQPGRASTTIRPLSR